MRNELNKDVLHASDKHMKCTVSVDSSSVFHYAHSVQQEHINSGTDVSAQFATNSFRLPCSVNEHTASGTAPERSFLSSLNIRKDTNFCSSAGTIPVRVLFLKLRILSEARLPISIGTVPVISLFCRDRSSIAAKFPMAGGISLAMELFARCSFLNRFMSRTLSGMGPSSILSSRNSTSRLVMPLKSGMVPRKRFDWRCNFLRDGKLPTVHGSVPPSLFPSARKYSSVSMIPIDGGSVPPNLFLSR
mmetsp:Transcript_31787/g.95161  ORF Transcript_31787/g.95161 Transcript_31787/m.95161 type:complete len:246 (-) Transcript_31787:966-1703(-)